MNPEARLRRIEKELSVQFTTRYSYSHEQIIRAARLQLHFQEKYGVKAPWNSIWAVLGPPTERLAPGEPGTVDLICAARRSAKLTAGDAAEGA